jgi:UDP-2-acetamido-3-amino-2,3-dideoxy-glucuronate N-acetyltransferase
MNETFFAHESAIIDQGCVIGQGTKIWHFTHVMSDCVIGEHCNLGQNVVVSPGVRLGNNVKVQNNVSIYTGVICEDDQYKQTIVEKGASIGANATIVCGVRIGQFAFIGAGAVVTKDVAAFELVVGNPARHSGWMSEFGHRLKFDDHGVAVCPESKEKYRLTNNTVTKIE